jgi:hypothetical protein
MVTTDQLEQFCAAIQGLQTDTTKTVDYELGKKYARVYKQDGAQRSAWGFVDLATGDILFAAGWKAPAKHVRGNISNGATGMGEHSPPRLR